LSPTDTELDSKTRAELDDIAEGLDLDPAEFSTKAELIEAIQAEQPDEDTDEDTDDEDEDEAEGPEIEPAQGDQVQPGAESDGKGNTLEEQQLLSYSSGTDVDVADVPDTKFAGESPPLILAGYWARLTDDESVPEEYVGHLVAVLESPWTSSPYAHDEQESAINGYRYDKDKLFLVKTRDAGNALLEVPFEALTEIGQSRSDVTAHA
jgi:hypothetical protein